MARLGISALPLPARDSDPELCPVDSKGKKLFETVGDAETEDEERQRCLRRHLKHLSDPCRIAEIERLIDRIDGMDRRGSLASARHLHDLRRRVVGALWQVVRDER